ncbi:MAG: putative transcriptional regulator [Klenkia sp.]|nr:putative transcriptional regulator [Klenkia sp.]
MDVRALETLRAVRSQGGVTAAAGVLHLTPSAVSQQLAGLTRDAGVALTERVGRGVRLTAAGEALADAAVDVAVALERARTACAVFQDGPTGTVRVAAFQSGAWLLFPRLLTRVAARGGIELRCSDEDVAQRAFAALTDSHDLVVAHRPEDGEPGWGEGVRVVPLLREPLDVALSVDHRWADRASLTPADLADEDWISVRTGFPLARALADVGLRSDTTPRVVQRINDFHVVEALVAAGHGIALLPRFACGGHPGVRLVPLAGARAGRQVDVLVRPDVAERRAVAVVLAELVAVAAEIGGGPGLRPG